jgi:cation diffusion facilitator CzcD-associated flavoprotein CzcO
MPRPSITIIGAGLGGLGTAIELERAGYTDITILEKADDVGGVWRDNTYPNAACDVPSSLYSWSFAPNPGWPHRYSRQDEILSYIRRTARELGALDHVHTGVEVTSAAYDESARSWHLTTAGGENIETDVLISAVGQLSRPSIPDLPGISSFEGPGFHSAEWDHSVDLKGRRIAVLGTGASAIQFVPGIQPDAAHVTVFQRSAPYVVPKPDRKYTKTHNRLFRDVPQTQTFGRRLTWVLSEQLNRSFRGWNPTTNAMELAWRVQLRTQVRDPQLRAKLVPDYQLGCKRLLFSSDWYPALAQANVELVTVPVVEVLPHGVRSGEGTVHEVDVIIYGTGFAATEFLAPSRSPASTEQICTSSGRAAPAPTLASACRTSRTCSWSTGRTPTSVAARLSICSSRRPTQSGPCSTTPDRAERAQWRSDPRPSSSSTKRFRNAWRTACGRDVRTGTARTVVGSPPTGQARSLSTSGDVPSWTLPTS